MKSKRLLNCFIVRLLARGAGEIFAGRQANCGSKKILLATSALLLAILTFAFCLLPLDQANGQTMSNGMFKVEMGNLNSIAGQSSGSKYNISITSGENAPGLYSGTNYKVRAGFQYIPRKKGFSFSISNALIDFGNLSPTNPVTRTTTLTVSNTSAASYQVTASENHQLLVAKTGAIIPDTTCDKGSCSQTTAADWSSTLTYGFGYRCDSISIVSQGSKSSSCNQKDSSFSKNPSFFKQFADASKSEASQVIVNGEKGRNQKATITYKVNIASSQATGVYTNSITYVATAGF